MLPMGAAFSPRRRVVVGARIDFIGRFDDIRRAEFAALELIFDKGVDVVLRLLLATAGF